MHPRCSGPLLCGLAWLGLALAARGATAHTWRVSPRPPRPHNLHSWELCAVTQQHSRKSARVVPSHHLRCGTGVIDSHFFISCLLSDNSCRASPALVYRPTHPFAASTHTVSTAHFFFPDTACCSKLANNGRKRCQAPSVPFIEPH